LLEGASVSKFDKSPIVANFKGLAKILSSDFDVFSTGYTTKSSVFCRRAKLVSKKRILKFWDKYEN